ncbi:MAG: NADH-quinone oxidoreductase subunit C [Thermoprotei archaeon]
MAETPHAQKLGLALGGSASVTEDQKAGLIEVRVEPKFLMDVSKKLKELGFDHCVSVTAVDYPRENYMDVIWHVSSYSNEELGDQLVSLTVRISRDEPRVASLVGVWESSLFSERETHEMFGVEFEGHPDLRPLLLPEELLGRWPLRKDFILPKRRSDLFRKGGAQP